MISISQLNKLLAEQHGVRIWHQHHDPLSELVAVILSQNTSDANSGRAFNSLRSRFHTWEEVAEADTVSIENAIKSGGLSRIKAARIKKILFTIMKQNGSLNLDFLGELPLHEAKAWLDELPGVGPKTVACVLLFAFGKPVFPVDTHVFRLSKRLGLIRNDVSANQAHRILGQIVPDEKVYQLHMNMVEHGRKICKAQRPYCDQCILDKMCPSFTDK